MGQPVDVPTTQDQRSVGELLADLSNESTTLIRKEAALAKAELSAKVSQAGSGLFILGISIAVMLAGLIELLDAASIALADVVPPENPWLAPLIVGVAVAIIGFILLQKGKSNLKAENLSLSRTTDSLRRDKELAKEQIK